MDEYNKALMAMAKEALESLEVQGLMRRTGEFRRGMYGDVQPVYALTTVGIWLQETGLMEEFEEYLELTNQKNVRTN